MFLVIWLGFAIVTAMAAPARGRSAWGWFALGLIFGGFALIAVLVLPSKAAAVLPDYPQPRLVPASELSVRPTMPPYHAQGSGQFDQEVRGESKFQDALTALAAPPRPDGYVIRATAVLRPEPQNPHDPYAVRVEINSRLVGYLPREDADVWCDMLLDASLDGRAVAAPARIVGGFLSTPDDVPLYGVRLDLAQPFAIKRFY